MLDLLLDGQRQNSFEGLTFCSEDHVRYRMASG